MTELKINAELDITGADKYEDDKVIKLGRSLSSLYHENETIRRNINKLKKEIHADLYGSNKIIDTTNLNKIHTLNLSFSSVSDVSNLLSLNTLDITNCGFVTDVSKLGSLHTLDLTGCNVTDISNLGSLHTLILTNYMNITDVGMLGKLHTLGLSGCKNIIDVSNSTIFK